MPIFGKFSAHGIFIWWPQVKGVNITSYVVQLQSNGADFSDHIIGTTIPIEEYQTWKDIEGNLEKISATTNVYPQSSDEKTKLTSSSTTSEGNENDSNNMITELRISGAVSGILIPNTKQITVRVLVPIYDEEGEIYQDFTYVEWKTVSIEENGLQLYNLRREYSSKNN